MKHIRTIAFGLAALVSAAPILAAQATQQAVPQAERGGRAEHGKRPGLGMHALVKGISLTNAEKANLKAVRGKYEPQFKALRESLGPDMKAVRNARQKGDSAAMKAAWANAAPGREKMKALMEQARGDERAALNPEHRDQFDKNVAAMQQRMAQARGRNGGQRHAEGKNSH